MNIREYYKKTAKSCYYVAWITLVMAIVFFICHILKLFPKDLLTLGNPSHNIKCCSFYFLWGLS